MANKWFDNPMTIELRSRLSEGFELAYMEHRMVVEAERELYEAKMRSLWHRRVLTWLKIARFFPIEHKHELMVPDKKFW